MTTISKTVAAMHPQAPNQSARMPDQGGHHQLADEHQQQDRVEEALGVLDQPHQHLAPRRPSSTRAMALARLMRTRLVSARASSGRDARRSTTTTDEDPVGRR